MYINGYEFIGLCVSIHCLMVPGDGTHCRLRSEGFVKPSDLRLQCLQIRDIVNFSIARVTEEQSNPGGNRTCYIMMES